MRKFQSQVLPALFFLATGASSNVAATALSGVTKIAAGFSATCAIVTGGAVKCWGSWPESGGAATRFVPGDVTGLSSGVVDISVGTSHACAVTASGGAKCWGSNGFGQLGNGGTSDTPTVTPVDVVGLASGVASIAAGSNHTCAVTTAGAVKCWGYRGSGILGDGDFAGTSATPVDVVGLGNGSTTRTWAGTWHTCALTSSGGLKCWGDGFAATLGTSTVAGPGLVPADVVGLSSGVLAADAGPSLSFAVTAGGGAKYWGSVFGLPHGITPADVPGLASGIVNVAVGDLQACALVTGGGVKCLGRNTSGQLGDGTTTDRSLPVDVIGLGGAVTAVTAGNAHSCALLASGQVKCWGNGAVGQLGNGSPLPRSIPAFVGEFIPQQIDFAPLPPRRLGDPAFGLTATATSALPVTLTASPPSACTLSGSTITLVGLGDCAVTARQDGDATYGDAQPVTRTFNISDPSAIRLSNISTRGRVSTGQAQLIAGFVIGAGQGNKKVAVVATGPSLIASGIVSPLPDPMIRLHGASGVIAINDNWQVGSSATELQLNGLAPANNVDAALVMDLAPGAYTAIVEDKALRSGVSVVGVYELDRYANRLMNISTRGEVLTGENVLIAGFIVSGSGPQQVAIVATGPSLGSQGITNPLANPTLTLARLSDQAVIATNDDWQAAANAVQLQATGFAPPHAAEAAILTTLPPGAYTAIVRGAGGTTGVAVVGVYAVP